MYIKHFWFKISVIFSSDKNYSVCVILGQLLIKGTPGNVVVLEPSAGTSHWQGLRFSSDNGKSFLNLANIGLFEVG